MISSDTEMTRIQNTYGLARRDRSENRSWVLHERTGNNGRRPGQDTDGWEDVGGDGALM